MINGGIGIVLIALFSGFIGLILGMWNVSKALKKADFEQLHQGQADLQKKLTAFANESLTEHKNLAVKHEKLEHRFDKVEDAVLKYLRKKQTAPRSPFKWIG